MNTWNNAVTYVLESLRRGVHPDYILAATQTRHMFDSACRHILQHLQTKGFLDGPLTFANLKAKVAADPEQKKNFEKLMAI